MNSVTDCAQLTWFGHAAFLLEGANGTRILLDPYRTPDAGTYAPINVPADIVLVSHLNAKYHSHWDAASGNPIRLNGLDFAGDPNGTAAHGIQFRAVQVWESAERTVPVSMPYFSMDGMTFCHSGDIGHGLTADEAAPLAGTDVFLAVAGGPPTVSLPEMRALIELAQPRLVIPMHYQNGKVNLPLQPLEEFLAFFAPEQIVYHPTSTLTLCSETLPDALQVVVLPSAR